MLTALQALQGLAVCAAAGEEGPYKILVEVITTVVTFLLVMAMLKKYAFGPILSVIEERRLRIEMDLKKAADLQQQAEAERAALEERLRNIETEARERMHQMSGEGKRIAQTIQENAQKDARALVEKAQQNIQFEMEKARVTLKEEIVTLTIEATQRLIKERLDDDKHRQLIGEFISQIERN